MHASRRVRLVNSDEFTEHLTHLSTSEQLYEKDMGASGSHNSKTTQVVFPFEKLPEELIIHILTFVPAKDIILNLRRVCKSWKVIIDSKSLWIAKCHRDNVALPQDKQMSKILRHAHTKRKRNFFLMFAAYVFDLFRLFFDLFRFRVRFRLV